MRKEIIYTESGPPREVRAVPVQGGAGQDQHHLYGWGRVDQWMHRSPIVVSSCSIYAGHATGQAFAHAVRATGATFQRAFMCSSTASGVRARVCADCVAGPVDGIQRQIVRDLPAAKKGRGPLANEKRHLLPIRELAVGRRQDRNDAGDVPHLPRHGIKHPKNGILGVLFLHPYTSTPYDVTTTALMLCVLSMSCTYYATTLQRIGKFQLQN